MKYLFSKHNKIWVGIFFAFILMGSFKVHAQNVDNNYSVISNKYNVVKNKYFFVRKANDTNTLLLCKETSKSSCTIIGKTSDERLAEYDLSIYIQGYYKDMLYFSYSIPSVSGYFGYASTVAPLSA